MLMKNTSTPQAVTLPNGTTITQADLPPPTTTRWVASRKAAVVEGVLYGLLPQKEAMRRYGLSEEELRSWVVAIKAHGVNGLKATQMQDHRRE